MSQNPERFRVSDLGNLSISPYGKLSILPLTDGGFALGYPDFNSPVYSIGLARFDAAANPVSAKAYVHMCDVNWGNFIYLSQKHDGNIYLAINTSDCWAGYQEIYITTLDTAGNVLSIEGHNKAGFEDTHNLFNLRADPVTGNYTVVGTYRSQDEITGSYDYHYVHINKYNPAGALLFSNSISSTQNAFMPYNFDHSETFYDSAGLVSEYLVSGKGPGNYLYLMKVDSSGMLMWERKYFPAPNTFIVEISKINSYYYLLESQGANMFIRKTDSLGNTQLRLQIDSVIARKDFSAMKAVSGSRLLITGAMGQNVNIPVFLELDTSLMLLSTKYMPDASLLASEIIQADESALIAYKIPGDTAIFIEKVYVNTSCYFADTLLNSQLIPFNADSAASFVHGTFPTSGTVTITPAPRLYTATPDCINNGINFNESKNLPALILYPNPASQMVTLVFENPDGNDVICEITDLNAGLTLKEVLYGDNGTLNLTNYEPGIYVVTLTSKNYSIKRKLVIQK